MYIVFQKSLPPRDAGIMGAVDVMPVDVPLDL